VTATKQVTRMAMDFVRLAGELEEAGHPLRSVPLDGPHRHGSRTAADVTAVGRRFRGARRRLLRVVEVELARAASILEGATFVDVKGRCRHRDCPMRDRVQRGTLTCQVCGRPLGGDKS